jgi:hypothetical protein
MADGGFGFCLRACVPSKGRNGKETAVGSYQTLGRRANGPAQYMGLDSVGWTLGLPCHLNQQKKKQCKRREILQPIRSHNRR